MNLKPFDLEAAKRGEPIVTREGRPVKFIAHVPEAVYNCRVVTLTDNVIRTHLENGRYYSDGEASLDLFITPRKRTVWVNLWEDKREAHYYNSKETADDCWGGAPRIGNRAWPLEIEE